MLQQQLKEAEARTEMKDNYFKNWLDEQQTTSKLRDDIRGLNRKINTLEGRRYA